MLGEIFSVPVWHYSLPNFNQSKDEILSGVRKIRNSDSGGQHSNYKGYQSNLLHEYANLPEFNSIFSFIRSVSVPEVFNDFGMIENIEYTMNAWVNINTKNCFNDIHNHIMHPQTSIKNGTIILFSGVFYVNCPPNSGHLSFVSHLMNSLWNGLSIVKTRNKYSSQSSSIKPEEGQLYIWPSYLWHMVFPNESDEERISIAFDIQAKI